MADWTDIASLATAGGTLVLAIATCSAAFREQLHDTGVAPGDDDWLVSAGRHGNLDRDDPR